MTEKMPRDIPPPAPDREPLKTNVYRFAQNSVAALTPLFPYVDEGSIVPCLATFRGGPGRRFGRFQHFNTVDEVAIVFGTQGGRRRGAGLVFVGPKLHLVNGPLEDPEDRDSIAISVITQRQLYGKPHREEYRMICDKCDRRLFLYTIDGTPPKRGTRDEAPGPVAPFVTIVETYEAARRFNEDAEARRCKHCGHVNPPFPIEAWGWQAHVDQSEIAQMGKASLIDASRAPPPPAERGGGS